MSLYKLWSELDEDFKLLINNRIDNNGDGSSLLTLLRLIPGKRVEISTFLLQEFMTLYEHTENDFYFRVCGQQHMNVTLEDVLFLTNLPIIGRPIVPTDNRDQDAFYRLFSERTSLLSLVKLRNICCDTNRNSDERIKAVLLMIVTCLIAPNGNGQNCKTSYVQFIEKLDEVNSYAWGAAMLAYLYQGMKEWKTKDKAIDGFTWLVMGFFFSHFRGLYTIFNITAEENQAHNKPKLAYLIESLGRTGANHHKKINSALQLQLNLVHELLRQEENIEADVRPITWHPYNLEMLPPHLHDQIQYRTVVAPLFCYNYVERHCPHVVAKQFEVLDGVELQDVGSDMKTIKFKANRGNCSINFRDHYKKEVVQWDEIGSRLAENFQPAQQSTPEPEAAHQTPTFEVSPTNSPHLSEQVDTSEAGENAGENVGHRKRCRPGMATPTSYLVTGPRVNKGLWVNKKFTHSDDHVKAIWAKRKRK
ncbi:unnamed protein product [Trifolium pratense]|nr:unnamed protein product [Trifolium pratense]